MTKTVGFLFALIACSGGDDGGPSVDASSGSGSGSAATCTVTATATANTSNRTVNGVGAVQCDNAATIALDVCVQWNPDGAFKDIMCQSSTKSAVREAQLDNLSSCGIATGRRFRARVNATINGTAKPEVLSTEVGCE